MSVLSGLCCSSNFKHVLVIMATVMEVRVGVIAAPCSLLMFPNEAAHWLPGNRIKFGDACFSETLGLFVFLYSFSHL